MYTAPLLLPIGLVTLNARAFSPDWQPSDMGTWTYQITTDFTPPTISAQVSPTPNAAGWNNTDVTVTFTCADADSGVATCSAPVTLFSERAAISVTGEAIDNVGNRATATVVVNLDDTVPVVTVHAPADGDVVPPETVEVTIRGNAADRTSGVVSVLCGGVAATLDGQRYSCAVPVRRRSPSRATISPPRPT